MLLCCLDRRYAGTGYTLQFSIGAVSTVSTRFTAWAAAEADDGTPQCALFDAQGQCCDTSIDSCGLCGGDGSTCAVTVSLCITAASAADVDQSAFASDMAGALGVRAARAQVTSVAASDNCPTGSLEVAVTVTPPDADSHPEDSTASSMDSLVTSVNAQLADPTSAMRTAPTTALALPGVPAAVAREGVCGNTLCEAGEDGTTCASDCASVAPPGTSGVESSVVCEPGTGTGTGTGTGSGTGSGSGSGAGSDVGTDTGGLPTGSGGSVSFAGDAENCGLSYFVVAVAAATLVMLLAVAASSAVKICCKVHRPHLHTRRWTATFTTVGAGPWVRGGVLRCRVGATCCGVRDALVLP